MTSAAQAKAVIGRRLRTQGGACKALGSPLYADLLERAAEDAEAGGPIWSVLKGHEADPGPSALGLRLLGGLHRIALEGTAPELAAHYPSCGGDGDHDGAWHGLLTAMDEHLDEVRGLVHQGVQTNEVGRSAALLGGFLTVAQETALPMRVLEVGASAGLNLRWDRFRYEDGGRSWGPPNSPLVFADPFVGAPRPPLSVTPEVVTRRGCDRSPIDPLSTAGQTTLLSYVWPDQTERIGRLRAAFVVAASAPAPVDRADASVWLAAQLDPSDGDGTATVVFHSVVMQYLTEADRQAFAACVASAGAGASGRAPLAWLRMEPAKRAFEVRLTLWPGGEDRLLATAGAHGQQVNWLAAG